MPSRTLPPVAKLTAVEEAEKGAVKILTVPDERSVVKERVSVGRDAQSRRYSTFASGIVKATLEYGGSRTEIPAVL